jgi:hypothetical protein
VINNSSVLACHNVNTMNNNSDIFDQSLSFSFMKSPRIKKKWHVKLLMYAMILKRDLPSYSVTLISNRKKNSGRVYNVHGFIKLQSLEVTIMYSCCQLFHYVLIRLQFDVEFHYLRVH